MSYKSLLFCPDERAAQLVTQVLSDLEFTVEIASEPFATVKKLTDEHFDALVVDCQNEQDASLLFKAARNSAHNHGSLSVAVVEGQAGVAKAFRIGANLVLTKPINVEQSKGTLRVARGLLRKNEARAASPASSAGTSSSANPAPAEPTSAQGTETSRSNPSSSEPMPPIFNKATPKPASAPAMVSPEPHIAAAKTVPYSGLEVEKEPTPEPEAADVALLESLPQISVRPAVEPVAPALKAHAEPIAASTAGQAAAAAPALEKKPIEIKSAGAAPMVTNEPIVAESRTPELEMPAAVPTFSSFADTSSSESGVAKTLFKIAVILLFASAGYFAWLRLQPLQYLHRTPASPLETPAETTTSNPVTAPAAAPAPQNAPKNLSVAPVNSETTSSTQFPDDATNDAPVIIAAPHPTHNSRPEDIEVQEMPVSRDLKIPPTSKAENPRPLVVNSGTTKLGQKPLPVPPPALSIAAPNSSSAAIGNLIASTATLPKAPASTVRVSQGVSQGLILKKVAPVYPPMALQQRKAGTVQLLATIGKTGDISNVKVLSGDTLLSKAAADAVLRWKYRPYLLNGEPVEIETQISIVFKAPQ